MAQPEEQTAQPQRGWRTVLNGTLWTMLGLLAGLAVFAYARGGLPLVSDGLSGGVQMIVRFGLIIVVALLAAGLAEKLMPEEWMRTALGEEAGVRGLFLATAAGIITPSGPFVSVPLAAVMLRSGAATSAVVAFLASWSLLAIHRFVAWEVPLLGLRFALLRYGVCLLLPVGAGLLVRAFTRS